VSLTHSLRREAEPYAKRLERLPRSSKRTLSPLNVRDRPSPNNFLANALNQTFQLNGTSAASRVPTTPLSFDEIPPVSNAIISPTVKPRYMDIGVQKNLNFTRNTSTIPPSEDLSSCIIKLQAENHDLRAQVESWKRECEACRESLDGIHRWYNSSGSHPPGPSNFTPHLPQESSMHPRWRNRGITTDNRFQSMQIQEPDSPDEPIPLLTPSSSESIHGRTPTEARSVRMRSRGDIQGSQGQPYFEPQQHGRRRGPAEPTNRRRQGGKLRGSPSLDGSGKVIGSPASPNSSTTIEAGFSDTFPMTDATVAQDHDKVNDQVPPSPPSTVSDHAQVPKSPTVP
jgi:hypothetical protein